MEFALYFCKDLSDCAQLLRRFCKCIYNTPGFFSNYTTCFIVIIIKCLVPRFNTDYYII
jgi:hypothetical protein